MKLIVVPPLRLDEANGARTRTLEVYSRLRDRFNITFVVDRANEPSAEKHYLKLLKGCQTVGAYTGRNPVKLFLSFMRVVCSARKVDAVFCYANYQPSVLYSYFVARLAGKPLVITIHIIEETAIRRSYLMNKAFDYCSAILALDNGMIIKELNELFPGKPVFPIINGVDYAIYSSGNYPPDKVTDCIFVGVLTERKGEQDLIEVWRRIHLVRPRAMLKILAGVTPKQKAESFKIKAVQAGIQGGLSIHGYVSEEAKIEAYRRSLVFILPSRDEGMALVIPEALAAGLPVVIWDLPPFENIKKGIVKVPYHDIVAYSDAILKLLSDESYRISLGKEAQEYARSYLSWDAAAKLEYETITRLGEIVTIGEES